MHELNVYWLYWLSMTVYPLNSIPPGTPLSFVAGNLGIARAALEGMSLARPFPRTGARMKELVEIINGIIPCTPTKVQERLLTAFETTRLKNAAHALALSLEEESRHTYVLYIEDQRSLSAHSLVEKIERCFSEEVWDAIENLGKREFEESGKCLALERYTASGFHALRGVECVIRQYIAELRDAPL